MTKLVVESIIFYFFYHLLILSDFKSVRITRIEMYKRWTKINIFYGTWQFYL